ncbi:MAG: response regulator, partial [Rhodospirillaceae bacterium]
MTAEPQLPPVSGQVAPIRVLVVDDSGFMRLAIRKMVDRVEGIEVVGEARDGRSAIELARRLNPDVITMDLEMPKMDGLSAIREIMDACPTPIIVVSSLSQPGADDTLRA